MKNITIQKVVSKNFIVDIIASFQNIFGLNLTGYESMINKGVKQIEDELREKKIELKWYRYEISQLTNGAMAIMLYGDIK
ncbi:MAG: hypothetical protein ACXABK_06645 [Candidatus Heimdallarchaeaceae archaeon]|jgi:uncharacterized protein YbjQ (UPF0145 family)